MADGQKTQSITASLGAFSFVTALSGASVTLALPRMAQAFDVSATLSTQVVQVGLITTVIFLVMFGHAGDVFSKNAVYRAGGWVFIIGSLLTGLAPSFMGVLVGRFIQAIGSAMVMANANEHFSDKERSKALAYNSMFISVGSISGPAVGGLITSILSWRWIFLLNVPVAILIMVWAKNAFPRPKVSLAAIREQASRVNWVGQVIFSIGIVLMFSSSWIKIPGLDQFTNLMVFLIGGGIVTALSFLQDDFAPSPWIDPQVLRNVTFLTSTSVLFLAMFVNSFSNILLPFYLQDYLPFSPGQSGLIVAVQSVVMLMLSPFVGRLAANPARRPRLVTIGLIMLLVSQIGYAFYGGQVELGYILWPIIVNGIGMAFTLTPNNSITMGLVSPKLAGVAGSMNSLFRTIGMAVGISFATNFLYAQLPGVKHITRGLGATYLHASRVVFYVAVFASLVALIVNVWRTAASKSVM
ncbi:MFS transporter [Weissella confusa]|uniref:MFS transporter n=1 Tax=Weissella confusa TaxID=1583 RepID=A0A4Z0S1F1_WEICO|nr:MFS transporter [Weissella confusa]TGE71708.1 MFS transporter [Weissella confusa]